MSADPPTDLGHAAICIATFRRPAGLAALLDSLNAQDFDGATAQVSVIVVDNDPAHPARDQLGDVAARSCWPLTYVMEPAPGIVSARNRALDLVPDTADHVVFVDDDETVTPGWLHALIRTRFETGAAAVQGPMVPCYDSPPPIWIEALGVFRIGPFDQGEKLQFAATGNSLVDAGFLRALGLRFDPRFNLTGGEDEEFYGRLRDAGGAIRAARDAIAYDQVPADRMTRGWVLRRAFRRGNTLTRIALLRRRGRVMRLFKGPGAMARGLLWLLGPGLVSQTARMRGLSEIWRGAGMVVGFANVQFAEYATPATEEA